MFPGLGSDLNKLLYKRYLFPQCNPKSVAMTCRRSRQMTRDTLQGKKLWGVPAAGIESRCIRAAEMGDIFAVQLIALHCNSKSGVLTHLLFSAAASSGNLELMEFLLSRNCHWSYYTLCRAAESGSMETVRWLCDRGCPSGLHASLSSGYMIVSACQGGNVEIAQFFDEKGHRLTFANEYQEATNMAASSGSTEMLEWLLRHQPCYYTASMHTLEWAMGGRGGRRLLEWFWRASPQYAASKTNVMYGACSAALGGNLEVLEWLHEKKLLDLSSSRIMTAAAEGSHLGIMKFLWRQGCRFEGETFNAAWRCESPDIIQWMLQCGYHVTLGNVHTLNMDREQRDELADRILKHKYKGRPSDLQRELMMLRLQYIWEPLDYVKRKYLQLRASGGGDTQPDEEEREDAEEEEDRVGPQPKEKTKHAF